jgi:hypothetical protein
VVAEPALAPNDDMNGVIAPVKLLPPDDIGNGSEGAELAPPLPNSVLCEVGKLEPPKMLVAGLEDSEEPNREADGTAGCA